MTHPQHEQADHIGPTPSTPGSTPTTLDVIRWINDPTVSLQDKDAWLTAIEKRVDAARAEADDLRRELAKGATVRVAVKVSITVDEADGEAEPAVPWRPSGPKPTSEAKECPRAQWVDVTPKVQSEVDSLAQLVRRSIFRQGTYVPGDLHVVASGAGPATLSALAERATRSRTDALQRV